MAPATLWNKLYFGGELTAFKLTRCYFKILRRMAPKRETELHNMLLSNLSAKSTHRAHSWLLIGQPSLEISISCHSDGLVMGMGGQA